MDILARSHSPRLCSHCYRSSPRGDSKPIEALEARSLLTVSSFFINGQLSVASDGSDDITVRSNPFNPNLVQVLANGAPVTSLGTIQTSSVSSIVVEGGDGPNTIDLSGVSATRFKANLAITVNGKQGDDIITGSFNLSDTLHLKRESLRCHKSQVDDNTVTMIDDWAWRAGKGLLPAETYRIMFLEKREA